MDIVNIKSQFVKYILLGLIFTFFIFNSSAQQTETRKNVSIISWNIRDFGKTKTDSIINAIANIVHQYDIVAIQEVVSGYGGSQGVAKLVSILNRKGSKWDYSISNPTQSPPYKTEKYAYLWKTSKVSLLKKARLVSELNPIVYREPYLISFKIGNKKIEILNYHARKHKDKPENEITEIIKYLHTHNQTILLGDFNLTENHSVWKSLYANNYTSAIKNSATTLKNKCNKGLYIHNSIDNIYYNKQKVSLISTGKIDFVKDCDNLTIARNISDHLPVFIQFIIHL